MTQPLTETTIEQRLDKYELEREIIAARAAGESVRDTVSRLGLTREEYQRRLRTAAKRAARHISDETAVYLLNVLMRLDRSTHVVSRMVEAGDLRAANSLANLVNATANLAKVIIPPSVQQESVAIPQGEVAAKLVQMGLIIPQPLLQ
jgi:hypothetical protein